RRDVVDRSVVRQIAAGHLADAKKADHMLRQGTGQVTATTASKLGETCQKLRESRRGQAMRISRASRLLIPRDIVLADFGDGSLGEDVSRRGDMREFDVWIDEGEPGGDRRSGKFERCFGRFVRQFLTEESRRHWRVEHG